jgi:hypothetical protein
MNTVFWDVITCGPIEVHRHFGGTYCYIFRVVKQAKKEISMKEAASTPGLLFDPEDEGIYIR